MLGCGRRGGAPSCKELGSGIIPRRKVFFETVVSPLQAVLAGSLVASSIFYIYTDTIPASPLHAAARTVMDLKPRDRATPALRELHWLPVAERIQYKLCLLVHKSLLEHTLEYISDLLTLVANIPGRSTLRASSCGNLVVPRTRRRIGDADRAFSVAAPRAWNRLPTELKLQRSTDLFRRDLKTFCFILSTGTRM